MVNWDWYRIIVDYLDVGLLAHKNIDYLYGNFRITIQANSTCSKYYCLF